MTRGQREKLCEIMGYLWAKSDDALCAGYAEDLGNMLAEDEKVGALGNPPCVYVQELGKDTRVVDCIGRDFKEITSTNPYTIKAESAGEP